MINDLLHIRFYNLTYQYYYYYETITKVFNNIAEYLEFSNTFLNEYYRQLATIADKYGIIFIVNVYKVSSFRYEAEKLYITFDNDTNIEINCLDSRQAKDNYNYLKNIYDNLNIDSLIRRKNKFIVSPSIEEDIPNGLYSSISRATLNAEPGTVIILSDETHETGRIVTKSDVIYYCNNGIINSSALTLFWIENCFNFALYGDCTINGNDSIFTSLFTLNTEVNVYNENEFCSNYETRFNLKENNGQCYFSDYANVKTNAYIKCKNMESACLFDQDGDTNIDADIINCNYSLFIMNPDFNGSHINNVYLRNMNVVSDNILDSPLFNPQNPNNELNINFINFNYQNNSPLFRGVGATNATLNLINSVFNTHNNDIINNSDSGTFRQVIKLYGKNFTSKDYIYKTGAGSFNVTSL